MKPRLKWSLLYCAYYAAMQATLTRLLARLRVSSLLRCDYYRQRDDLTTWVRRTIINILSSLQFHAFLVVTSICLKWCVTINEITVLSMHLQGEAGFHHFLYHHHWPPSPSSLPSMCVFVVRVCVRYYTRDGDLKFPVYSDVQSHCRCYFCSCLCYVYECWCYSCLSLFDTSSLMKETQLQLKIVAGCLILYLCLRLHSAICVMSFIALVHCPGEFARAMYCELELCFKLIVTLAWFICLDISENSRERRF